MSQDMITESVRTYISNHMPQPNIVSLSMVSEELGLEYSQRCVNALKADKMKVTDTLQGYYIAQDSYELIKRYVRSYSPLYPLFCDELHKNTTEEKESVRAAYNAFQKKIDNCTTFIKLYFLSDSFSVGWFYNKAESTVVLETMHNWLATRYEQKASPFSDCITLFEASKKLNISPVYMLKWLKKDTLYYQKDGIYYFPKTKYVNKWLDLVAAARPLKDTVKKLVVDYPKLTTTKAFETLLPQLTSYPFIYLGSKILGLNISEWYFDSQNEGGVEAFVIEQLNFIPLYNIINLVSLTGLKHDEIIAKANAGYINAALTGENFLISKNEINRIELITKENVGLDAVVAPLVTETKSLFDYNNVINRNKLFEFIDGNDAWGIKLIDAADLPLINTKKNKYYVKLQDVECLCRHLNLWILSFGIANSDKINLLLEQFKEKFPKTHKALQEYYQQDKNQVEIESHMISTLDYLLSLLPCEIPDLDENAIHDMIIEPFIEEMPIVCCNSIANFLYESKLIHRNYEFSGSGYSPDTSAYSIKDFAVMAYTVLNPEAWEKYGLIQKAVSNKRYVDLWLFTMMHFFAAWRTTDFIRLSVPHLPYSPSQTLEMIRYGNYSERDAIQVSETVISTIKSLNYTPSKTSMHSYVPVLQIFVPESCLYPFGLVLSIAAAHYALDVNAKAFVVRISDIFTISRFFGQEFTEACNNKSFSTRRANKALMQGVETIADSNEEGPRPYLLASIMRSHKGGYGTLSNTTSIYLKDANFTGYTPEFIIYQMFERGVCSFLVNELLKQSFGCSYVQLPVKAQTSLIKATGLSAYSIDSIRGVVNKAEEMSQTIVKEALLSEDATQEKARQILINLIDGNGVGKSSLCLMIAAGQACRIPERVSCIGCKYEILTKSVLAHYLGEYCRISQELESEAIKSIPIECKRREQALHNIILPKIEEACTLAKQITLTPNELHEYDYLSKEILNHGNCINDTVG